MALNDLKLTGDDFAGKNVKSLPDKVQNNPEALKEMFDSLSEEVLAPRINEIINELVHNGAAGIGAGKMGVDDLSGDTVQAKLNALRASISTIKEGKIEPSSITKNQLSTAVSSALLFFSTAAPGKSDDVNDGFIPGSVWIETGTPALYLCKNNAANNAVWEVYASTAGLVGNSVFGGTTGRKIDHFLGHTNYTISVTPKDDASATVGAIYYKDKGPDFIWVCNTGSSVEPFDYMILEG